VRTQENLPGVSVKLFYADSFIVGGTSDDKGELWISNLPANEYRLEISHTGYKNSTKELSLRPGATEYVTTYLISEDDTLTSSHQISTQPGGVRGFIVDSDTGEILPLVTVKVFKEGKLVAGVDSDFDGFFQVNKLKPGSYELSFEYIGYQSQLLTIDHIEAGKMISQRVNLLADAAPELPVIIIEHHGEE
jgi:uncharacterized surface anchored protein